MAMPTNLRKSIRNQARRVLETGSRFDRFDQIRSRHFWSVYQFLPDANGYIASGDFKVFVTPEGQNGQGFPAGVAMSALETDFKGTARVPDNQNLSIGEIGVTLAVAPPATVPEGVSAGDVPFGQTAATFFENTLCAITYLTNTVELGFVEDFSQPAGPQLGNYIPSVPGGQVTRVTARVVTNGFSAPGLRRRFKIPIMLGHGETFNFTYLIPRSFFVGQVALYARFDAWATESFVEKS
jgi:hypothetical protein